MFVLSVESGSQAGGPGPGNFKISSREDISKLLDSNIEIVYVDTSQEVAPSQSMNERPGPVKDIVGPADTFEASLDDFMTGMESPVDIYWSDDSGEFSLVCRRGLTYTEEVEEVLKGAGGGSVRIPLDQFGAFEEFKKRIEEERDKRESCAFRVSPKEIAEHVAFIKSYHPVSPVVLIAGTRVGFDIFVKKEKLEVAVEKGGRLDGSLREKWALEDANVLIRKGDMEAYRAYMLEHGKDSENPEVKAAMIRENSRIIIENLAENPRSEKLMMETKESVKDLTSMVMDNPTSFYGLMKINNYDYYTFTHSVNVSTLSLALAISAGVSAKDELSDLGLGCVLHDLGKSRVGSELINKPGRLTDGEFKKVKNHVLLGYDMIKGNESVPERAFYPLLQHHEKLSGSGYPNGIGGDQIHLFGRIAALIDIYDALTTERSYKKAFSPYDALALISKNENDYDARLFTVFVGLIHSQKT